MPSRPESLLVVGYPEFWPIADRANRQVLETFEKNADFFKRILHLETEDQPLHIVLRRMTISAWSTFLALNILVLNGHGPGANILMRTIFETGLNMFHLTSDVEGLNDFVGFSAILQKKLFDLMDSKQQASTDPHMVNRMNDAFNSQVHRFQEKKGRVRDRWCRFSVRKLAEQSGRIRLYETLYWRTSQVHHGDVGGIIQVTDLDGAPIIPLR